MDGIIKRRSFLVGYIHSMLSQLEQRMLVLKRIYGYVMTSSERRRSEDSIIEIDPAFTGNRTDFSAIDISKVTTLEPSELIKPIGKGNDKIFKRIQIVNKKISK